MIGWAQTWGLVLLTGTLVPGVAASQEIHKGIVVEQVAANFEGERAGLQQGDVILRWARGDAHGEIESPFDLLRIEIEQEPRGPVTLEGFRLFERQTWSLGPHAWRIQTRPDFPPKLLEPYLAGERLAVSGKQIGASEQWKATAKLAEADGSGWLAAWLVFHAAESLTDPRLSKESDNDYREAIEQVPKESPLARAQLFRSWGNQCEQRGDLRSARLHFEQFRAEVRKAFTEETLELADALNSLGRTYAKLGDLVNAEKHFQQALAARQRLAPGSLALAATINNLGLIAQSRGDLTKADDDLRQALAIRKTLVPESLDVATNLNNLGAVAEERGDLPEAESLYLQSLDIRRKLSPDNIDVATILSNLGYVANQRGQFEKAEDYAQEALKIQQRLAPDSADVARTFNILGILAEDRGDLAEAEKYHLLALDIRKRRLSPRSLDLAASLFNLGDVAWLRGDLVTAEKFHRQSLLIKQKQAPDSLTIARSFTALGLLAEERRQWTRAEHYLGRALRINQKKAPRGLAVAVSLNHLGRVAYQQHQAQKARNYLQQALEIEEKQAPAGPDIAATLALLGDLMRDQGKLNEAEMFYRRSLAIREKLTPGSIYHAESLAKVGNALRLKRQPEAAIQAFDQALNALENQTARLGGAAGIRLGYRATYAAYYENYIELLMEENKAERAFEVLERSRGRTLLELLAEAHLDIRKGVDPSLLKRERSLRERLTARVNFQMRLLNQQGTESQAGAVLGEIERLLNEYQQVQGQIRTSSPSYAALTQPQPLPVRQIQQQLLDQETVLLEYSLGNERSYAWVATSESLYAHVLPARARIERVAERLYQLLSSRPDSASQEELNRTATTLSHLVLDPVASEIQGKRLLIVSDGALHYIPFAMLPTPNAGRARRGRQLTLGEIHEILSSPSATVSSLVRKAQADRKVASKSVAVLADPVFDVWDPRVRNHSGRQIGGLAFMPKSVSTMGWSHLARLPFSQREAAAILEVTPPGQGMKALGFQASRALATSERLNEYRIVHFSTHGLLNNQHPEFSGLVLSLVDEHGDPQNGFLLLQDIYNLNLPVEMVVLSACETALGKQIRGEGLIGLTRGFMYAGATRVLASLWNADDVATAELMARFYKALEQEGMTPSAALRKAQIQMERQKRWQAPYYWAAFQLQGDW
jgi:CHAT domain-containing protein/Tfp pilus assembly protein PilF